MSMQASQLLPLCDWLAAAVSMKVDCRCSMMVCGPRCVTGTGHSSTQMSPVNPPLVLGRALMVCVSVDVWCMCAGVYMNVCDVCECVCGYEYVCVCVCHNDLVLKGVQEKRNEVLETKVDRMWVSNAFFEWTHVKSSTSQGRRLCCSSFLRNLTFSVICNSMLIITQAHITAANHAVNCKNPTDVIHMSITKWTCSVSHRTACYAWFVAMDNVQHTASLEHF